MTDKSFISVLMLLFFALFSCETKQQIQEQDIAARVYDKYLYIDEVQKKIPAELRAEDSVLFAQDYIEKWIRSELVLYEAKKNVKEEDLNIDEFINHYKNNLLIYEFEKLLIFQKLDSVVSEQEIEHYYENNKDLFRLNEDMVNIRYMLMSKDNKPINKAQRYIAYQNEEELNDLEAFCKENCRDFSIDDNWVSLIDLQEFTPFDIQKNKNELKDGKTLVLSDSTKYYILYVNDYKKMNDISPMVLEKEKIKNIILNNRKSKLIDEMKTEIYKNARSKNAFEIYKH